MNPTGLVVRDPRVEAALAHARGDNLVDLYDAWRELRLAQATASAERARAREQLEVRAETVLRSVESARRLGQPGPAPLPGQEPLAAPDPLAEFVAASQRELAAAREELESRTVAEEQLFSTELEALRSRLVAKAELLLAHHRPRLEVQVQPVGRERGLLHLGRLEEQDVVLAGFLFTGKLLTRWDAFRDDAVDQVGEEPARLYVEENSPRARYDRLEDEEAVFDDPSTRFLPARGVLPLRIPGYAFPRFRLVNRGPVIEAEARSEGGGYEALMPRASAELLSGYLIRLKVDGKIELKLSVG